jgi:hypothetical protein
MARQEAMEHMAINVIVWPDASMEQHAMCGVGRTSEHLVGLLKIMVAKTGL